jgi:hypothetical protein
MITEKHYKIPPRIKFTTDENKALYNVLDNTIYINPDTYLDLIYHEWKHFVQQPDWRISVNKRYQRYNKLLTKVKLNDMYWNRFKNCYSPRYAKIVQMYLREFSIEKEAYLFQIKKSPNRDSSHFTKNHMSNIK